jgi:toxin CcdB
LGQFDVHRLSKGRFAIDCQSDLLSHLQSRLVVPLVPKDSAPRAARRLNPIFEIGEVQHVMLTQFAGTIDRRQLGDVVTSLADRSFEITDALDVLITGV